MTVACKELECLMIQTLLFALSTGPGEEEEEEGEKEIYNNRWSASTYPW